LATEQRGRLRGILEKEKGLESHSITEAAIAIQLRAPGVLVTFDGCLVFVEEGAESEAVRELEDHLNSGIRFTISGLVFVVKAGSEERVFRYRVDRTPEGDTALSLAGETLIQRSN
jgi:hypothetical protein